MSEGFEVGDRIHMQLPRGWVDVWIERIRTLRWNVPTTEMVHCHITDISPGGMNRVTR